MNFIGIDISLNSTAIYIENDKKYTLSFTNKKDNNKWIKELEQYGVLFYFQERTSVKDYSENEFIKINHFIQQSELMVDEIISRIDMTEKTYCLIEGYSFSKNTSSILDIVSLSTLIRAELVKKINNIHLSIISPISLKLEACKLCYEPIDIGIKKPKLIYRNHEGLAGGSFKKPHMMKAMIEGEIDSPIYQFLLTNKDLMNRDKIPNPIEDIIDSIFACKVKKNSIIG
jgi:hypothetical protein